VPLKVYRTDIQKILEDIQGTGKVIETAAQNGVELYTMQLDEGMTALIADLPSLEDESIENVLAVSETFYSFFSR
jgi:hypothetical protein